MDDHFLTRLQTSKLKEMSELASVPIFLRTIGAIIVIATEYDKLFKTGINLSNTPCSRSGSIRLIYYEQTSLQLIPLLKDMHPHFKGKKAKEDFDFSKASNYDAEATDKYLEMGNRLQKEGSYYEAIEMYKKNLRTNLMVPSINKIANCYFYLELYQQAIKWYKKGLNLDRKNKFALNGLGNVYDMLGDHEKALKHFNEAIKIDKKFSYPYNSLGNFYFKKGEYIAAMKYYEDGIKFSPENCQIKLNLARCFMHLRKYSLSFYQLQKVHNLLKQKPNECEEKYGWIVQEFRDKIKSQTKAEISRMKNEFAKRPFLGKNLSTEEIDLQKALKQLLDLKNIIVESTT